MSLSVKKFLQPSQIMPLYWSWCKPMLKKVVPSFFNMSEEKVMGLEAVLEVNARERLDDLTGVTLFDRRSFDDLTGVTSFDMR